MTINILFGIIIYVISFSIVLLITIPLMIVASEIDDKLEMMHNTTDQS